MDISEFQKNRLGICHLIFQATLLAVVIPFILWGCGGDDSDGGKSDSSEDTQQEDNMTQVTEWQRLEVKQITAGGLTSPKVKSVFNDNIIHMVYLDKSHTADGLYDVNYLTLDKQLLSSSSDNAAVSFADSIASPIVSPIVSIDNCQTLAIGAGQSIDTFIPPVIAYRGGETRMCGSQQQSDAMINIMENGEWREYTGAMGEVERNPVFTDGLAGTTVSVAIDSSGDVHLCYQFFYEGCDSMNYKYPDLCYVKKDRANIDTILIEEETVEGNQYASTNIQNSAGDHCVITFDLLENPVIFYYAELQDNSRGLRVARRQNDTWEKRWIEEDCVIGDITTAGCDSDGNLSVAYYVTQYTDEREAAHNLKFAEESESGWKVSTIDDTAMCGNYCSMSYDSTGNPAIVYYEIKSHSGYDLKNLKFARRNGNSWNIETVDDSGDIGLYNSLWFDENNTVIISTFSNTEKTIYIYYR